MDSGVDSTSSNKSPIVCKLIIKKDPNSHMIYFLSKQSLNEFCVSIATFKSSIQHDIHFVNYG